MKQKILLLIKEPPPITGATLMNSYVQQSKLLRETFEVSELLISYASDVNELGKWRIRKFRIIVTKIFELLRTIILNRPQLIYFQISPLGLAFLRDLIYVCIIKLFRVKIVFHLHGKGIVNASRNNLLKFLYRYTFRNNEVICLSEKLANDIEEVFIKKPFIVPNGIPNGVIAFERTYNINKITLLFLSNLFISKGILDYIDTLELLNQKGIHFRGIIVGKPGDLTPSDVLNLIKQKNLIGFLEYLGAKYEDEKKEILKKSDILIFPTKMKHESFPVVLLEALQNGIPVITTDEGAISEIIEDGINGFIVEKNNPQQIAEKVELLIDNPELRKKMGEAGRKKYEEKYTLAIFENNIKIVFEKVLKEVNGEKNV